MISYILYALGLLLSWDTMDDGWRRDGLHGRARWTCHILWPLVVAIWLLVRSCLFLLGLFFQIKRKIGGAK